MKAAYLRFTIAVPPPTFFVHVINKYINRYKHTHTGKWNFKAEAEKLHSPHNQLQYREKCECFGGKKEKARNYFFYIFSQGL